MGLTSRDDPAARGDESASTPSRSFVAAAREPIIVAIFVLAGIFEVLSGDPVAHGAVLFAVGGLLSWDAVHRRHQERDPSPAEPSVEPLPRPRVKPAVVFAGWLTQRWRERSGVIRGRRQSRSWDPEPRALRWRGASRHTRPQIRSGWIRGGQCHGSLCSRRWRCGSSRRYCSSHRSPHHRPPIRRSAP